MTCINKLFSSDTNNYYNGHYAFPSLSFKQNTGHEDAKGQNSFDT